MFKSYFQNVLGLDVEEKSDEDILNMGLEKLWDVYRQFGIATTFRDLTDVPADNKELITMVVNMGEMPSQYGTFTTERLSRVLLNALG